MARRFKPPWTAERIAGGYVVKDATGQALVYVYVCAPVSSQELCQAKCLTLTLASDNGERRRSQTDIRSPS